MDGLPHEEIRPETRQDIQDGLRVDASREIYLPVEARLEQGVDRLIARINAFQAENMRLKEQKAALKAENIKLATEFKTLEDALRHEQALRMEAYARISALLEKIRAYRSSL